MPGQSRNLKDILQAALLTGAYVKNNNTVVKQISP
jgi:hypothetical protein